MPSQVRERIDFFVLEQLERIGDTLALTHFKDRSGELFDTSPRIVIVEGRWSFMTCRCTLRPMVSSSASSKASTCWATVSIVRVTS